MNAYEKIRECIYHPNTAKEDQALAALAELERAASEPVAWMWNDLIGIPHTYVSPTRPTWPDAGSSPAMAVAINVRPLYAAPVAEIREPTPEECERICTEYERLLMREGTCGGRDAFDAVRAVMWPKSEGCDGRRQTVVADS